MLPYSTYVTQSNLPIDTITVLDDTYNPVDILALENKKPCFPTNRKNLNGTFWTIEQRIVSPQPSFVPPTSKPMILMTPRLEHWKSIDPSLKKFSEVKKDNDIKMTNYSVGSIGRHFFLLSDVRTDEMTPVRSYRTYQKSLSTSAPYFGNWVPVPSGSLTWSTGDKTTSWVGSPPKGCAQSGYLYYRHDVPWLMSNIRPFQRVINNFDYTFFPDIPDKNEWKQPQLDRFISTVIAQSTIKLRSDLDVLTNIVELPKSLKTLKSLYEDIGVYTRRIVKEIKNTSPKAKNFKDLSTELQSKWMEYRYGIMPMLYTVQDTLSMIENQFLSFKTGRAKLVVDISQTAPLFINTLSHRERFDTVDGTITISATAKAKFTSSLSSALYTVQVNPFVTGWELLPLSFVVDWFINVGDVISHNTTSLALCIWDIAEEKGCYSIRSQYTLNKYVMCKDESYLDNKLTKTSLKPVLCERRFVNTYERKVFVPTDLLMPQFQSDVYANWMRIIDSFIISKNTFKKSLRSF